MRYYKQVLDNYILSISVENGETEITENEYNDILSFVQNNIRTVGKGCHLRADLTWEEYDLPIDPIDETATEDEMREALTILGVDVP